MLPLYLSGILRPSSKRAAGVYRAIFEALLHGLRLLAKLLMTANL